MSSEVSSDRSADGSLAGSPGAHGRRAGAPPARSGRGRLAGLLPIALSLLYLNLLFTYANRPSTPWVEPTLRLSVELLLLVGLLALARTLGLSLGGWSRGLLALLVSAAALLRYVELTALGVMGRELDLDADLPHVWNVRGMFQEALPGPLFLGIAAAVLLVLLLFVVLNRLAVGALDRGLESRPARLGALGLCAVGLLALAGRGLLGGEVRLFARPVAAIALDQLVDLRGDPEAERAALAASPPGPPDLGRLGGAHVILIFLESYGVTLIEDEQHLPYIAPHYARLEERLLEAGYSMRSSQIGSPTFAGGSWRAHATLLSGIRLSNQHLYERLLASERRTLVHLLAGAGYRTVAVEPGIQGAWPEADYFAFDRIYDAAALDYRGKPIGWWKIPDQYTLYRLYREELEAPSGPVFAKVALIMTHIPYFPIPPYVPDWSRFDDGTAYARSLPSVAVDDYRDLRELSSRYVASFVYELEILEDFLVDLVPENSLVIVTGDHQPPTLATHTNDSWAVPIHLLSRRRELVEPFASHGYGQGLLPREPSELEMEHFLAAFLAAASSP